MKLRIVSEEDGRLEMEVGGEGHTLLNLLQSSLLENKNVNMAGYSKPHPLMDRSVLYVYMEGRRSSKRALLKSANDAKKKVDEFLTKFEREVEKQKG